MTLVSATDEIPAHMVVWSSVLGQWTAPQRHGSMLYIPGGHRLPQVFTLTTRHVKGDV